VSRDKLTKAKIKFPFPHMMSIVVKEKASHSLQLLAQVIRKMPGNCVELPSNKNVNIFRELVTSFRMSVKTFGTAKISDLCQTTNGNYFWIFTRDHR